MPIWQGSCSSN